MTIADNEEAGSRPKFTFSLLGPLRGWRGSDLLDLGTPQQRLVLAALLAGDDSRTTVDTIANAVWGDVLPRSFRVTIRTYVHRLRSLLGPEAIESVTDGYVFARDHAAVDLWRLRTLTTQGSRDDHDRIGRALQDTLRAWQDVPLAGLTGKFVDEFRAEMAELRLEAVERMATSLAEAGHPDPLAELADAVQASPLRERLRELQMRALYRAGQPMKALATFSEYERLIRADRGARPGADLLALHDRVLSGARLHNATTLPPPRLPGAPPGFVGRVEELELLNSSGLWEQGKGLVLITGMAGVGKSSLALRWAHQATAHFPDGQIYVDLQGFRNDVAPLSPGAAMLSVLESLGHRREDLPAGLEDLTARYRQEMTRHRYLLLLDNAQDANQLEPFITGGISCAVLVTSRAKLSLPTHADRPTTIQLDVPRQAEAEELFSKLVGRKSAEDDAAATTRIIDRCGRLPLALALIGARAKTHTTWPLTSFVEVLEEDHEYLDAFDTAEAGGGVRSALAGSFNTLSHEASKLLLLLTEHRPGEEFSANDAAELVNTPVAEAHVLLHEIANANLVSKLSSNGFALHELVHAFASEVLTSSNLTQSVKADEM